MSAEEHEFMTSLLDWFTEIEQWIPGARSKVGELILGPLPLAHANDVYDLADHWGALADSLNAAYEDVMQAANPILENWSGDGAAQMFTQDWFNYLEGLRQSAESAAQMRQGAQNFGLEVELMKFMAAINLVMLAYSLFAIAAAAGPSLGAALLGVPAAFAAAKTAIFAAARQAISKIMSLSMRIVMRDIGMLFTRLPGALTHTLPTTLRNGATRLGPAIASRVNVPAMRTAITQGARDIWAQGFNQTVRNIGARGISTSVANRIAAQSLRTLAAEQVGAGLGRQMSREAQRQMAKEIRNQLLLKWAGKEGADAAASGLSRIAVDRIGQSMLGREFAQYVGTRVGIGAGFMGGGNLVGQIGQIVSGNRTDGVDWAQVRDNTIQGGAAGLGMFGGVTGHTIGGGLAAGGYTLGAQTVDYIRSDGEKGLNWNEIWLSARDGAASGLFAGVETVLEPGLPNLTRDDSGALRIGSDVHFIAGEDGTFSIAGTSRGESLLLTSDGYVAHQGADGVRTVDTEITGRGDVTEGISRVFDSPETRTDSGGGAGEASSRGSDAAPVPGHPSSTPDGVRANDSTTTVADRAPDSERSVPDRTSANDGGSTAARQEATTRGDGGGDPPDTTRAASGDGGSTAARQETSTRGDSGGDSPDSTRAASNDGGSPAARQEATTRADGGGDPPDSGTTARPEQNTAESVRTAPSDGNRTPASDSRTSTSETHRPTASDQSTIGTGHPAAATEHSTTATDRGATTPTGEQSRVTGDQVTPRAGAESSAGRDGTSGVPTKGESGPPDGPPPDRTTAAPDRTAASSGRTTHDAAPDRTHETAADRTHEASSDRTHEAADNAGRESDHPADAATGGAIRPRDDIRAFDWAERAYDRFRGDDADVAEIAGNLSDVQRADGTTGYSVAEINQIKQHLMVEEHPIRDYDGVLEHRRFDASPDIAEAWIRLREGNPLPEDLVLLNHELAESNHMRAHPDADYTTAHQHANEQHNWQDIVPGRTGEDLDGKWGRQDGDGASGSLPEGSRGRETGGVSFRPPDDGSAAGDRQNVDGGQPGGREPGQTVRGGVEQDPAPAPRAGDVATGRDVRGVDPATRNGPAGERMHGDVPAGERVPGDGPSHGSAPDPASTESPLLASNGAGTGLPPTPETIRQGTVRMEDHPDYPRAVETLAEQGFSVLPSQEGHPHTVIRHVVDPKTHEVLRVEREVRVVEGMRYLDLEHEMAHVRASVERFGPGEHPPSEIYRDRPGNTPKEMTKVRGRLTTEQNTIGEYQVRLEEYLRLSERGVDPDVLAEHVAGVDKHRGDYHEVMNDAWDKKNSKEWAREHYPDIRDLEARYDELRAAETDGTGTDPRTGQPSTGGDSTPMAKAPGGVDPYRMLPVEGPKPVDPVNVPHEVARLIGDEMGDLVAGRDGVAPDQPQRADWDADAGTLRVRYGDGLEVDVIVQVNESVPPGQAVVVRPSLEMVDGTWQQTSAAGVVVSSHMSADPATRAAHVSEALDAAWRTMHDEIGPQLRDPDGPAVTPRDPDGPMPPARDQGGLPVDHLSGPEAMRALEEPLTSGDVPVRDADGVGMHRADPAAAPSPAALTPETVRQALTSTRGPEQISRWAGDHLSDRDQNGTARPKTADEITEVVDRHAGEALNRVTPAPDVASVVHTASPIEGTRFVPEGRSPYESPVHLGELHQAINDVLPGDFSDGGIVRISSDGVDIRVDKADGTTGYFRPELGVNMPDLAETTVRSGTPQDPHIVRVNNRVSADNLSRVWVHEITETLAVQHAAATRPEPQGMLRRAMTKLGNLFGGGRPETTRVDPHAAARVNERVHLQRRLNEAWARPDVQQRLRQEIAGVERDLEKLGHPVPRSLFEDIGRRTGPSPFGSHDSLGSRMRPDVIGQSEPMGRPEAPARNGLLGRSGVIGETGPVSGSRYGDDAVPRHDDFTAHRYEQEPPAAHHQPDPHAEPEASHIPDLQDPTPPDVGDGPREPGEPRPSLRDLFPRTTGSTVDWSTVVQKVFDREFLNRDFKGFDVQVDHAYSAQDGFSVRMSVWEHGDDTKPVGHITRRFSYSQDQDLLVATHASLTIDEGLQGSGFAKAFNDHMEEWYVESGVDRIAIHASMDVGGYAWARAGFGWDTQNWGGAEADGAFTRLRSEIRQLSEDLSDWGAAKNRDEIRERHRYGESVDVEEHLTTQKKAAEQLYRQYRTSTYGDADFPTPQEISQVGRDGESGAGATWIGKRVMLGYDWHGAKEPTGGIEAPLRAESPNPPTVEKPVFNDDSPVYPPDDAGRDDRNLPGMRGQWGQSWGVDEAQPHTGDTAYSPSVDEPAENYHRPDEGREYFHHSDADPLAKWGPAYETHPEAWNEAIAEAESFGVEVITRTGGLAYGPGGSPGTPGQLILDPEASYGALLHELRHMRDDQEAGWVGMRGWFTDMEVRFQGEVRAYQVEIDYAESIGDHESAQKLRELLAEEHKKITGEQ
ncbi:hypothetical protein [Actinoplanes sp. NBRC 101535]|uniref:WXG100-like domain-containing protein n=1 Tax=Actinoplanes sp. NBRC 101535 TaxID=3032196 RepID=UPI0024A580F5|nr:hypothetical protein [Actinoplanes sp. NBRC 101535]GLY01594.1 hypothetical protein Acsp01_19730 [Actinoplanes sp. NBRC 101535]